MAMISIGVNRSTVLAARKAILDILKCPKTEERTKRVALTVLSSLCNSGNNTFTGCTFQGGRRGA